MHKLKKFYPLVPILSGVLPMMASAVTINNLLERTKNMVGIFIPLLMTIAIAIFLYGIVLYITSAGNAEKEKAALPELPDYPAFDHSRLLEMGLSDEDAKEFVQELITQIETEIPLIKEAMVQKDFHQMERVTHGIKGSSTNVGTGGVSDLIIEYNTYLKTGDDIQVAQSYFEALKNELEKLKAQYL